MHKVHCPTCSARYSVPTEKLGKRIKCAKCGGRFELVSQVAFDDLGFPELVPGQPLPTLPPFNPATSIPTLASRRGAAPAQPPAGGLAAYFRDIFGTFRMIAHPSDLATLAVVCAVCLLQILTRFGGGMGMAGTAIIRGWFLSFLLRTVQGGAARDNGLPDFSLSEGLLEDVIKPSLSFVAVRLIATLPLIGTLIFAARDERIEMEIAILFGIFGVLAPEWALMAALLMADQVPGLLTIVAPALLIGLAAMPMLLLVVALEGVEALLRIDLMLVTVLRTLPGYLVATAIYFGAILVPVGVSYAIELALSVESPVATNPVPATRIKAPAAVTSPNAISAIPQPAGDPNSSDPNATNPAISPAPGGILAVPGGPAKRNAGSPTRRFAGSLAGDAVGVLLNVIASIFAMRAIGLYYAHFKRGFAFAWG